MTLKQMRLNKKLTQIQVSNEFGVSQVTISQWESGDTYPQMDKLKNLAKLYGVTTDDVIAACEQARAQRQNSA